MKIGLLLVKANYCALFRQPAVGQCLTCVSIALRTSVSFSVDKNRTDTTEQPHRIYSSDRITVENEPVKSGACIILNNKRCFDSGIGK